MSDTNDSETGDSDRELLTAEESLDLLRRTCLIHATVHDEPQDCSLGTESDP